MPWYLKEHFEPIPISIHGIRGKLKGHTKLGQLRVDGGRGRGKKKDAYDIKGMKFKECWRLN